MASFGGHFLFCHVVADPDSPTHQGEHEIHYYGFGRPSFRNFRKEEGVSWRVEVIDTWEMTVTDLGIFSGNFRVPLPGKEYMAIRLRKVWQKGRQHSPLVALFKIRGPKQRASDCGISPDGSRKQWQGEARGTSASLLRKAPESHFTHKRGQQKSRTSQGEVRDLGAAACRWSGRRESNPRIQLGKLMFYH